MTFAYNTYHAGQHEDARLRELWPTCPARGIFIDVGAGNGITASNTLHFLRNGWSGLLIDADPRQCELLKTNRPGEGIQNVAVCGHDGEVTIYLTGHLDHASLLPDLYGGEKTQVAAATLEALLQRHGIEKIDLLSIDVEGAELAAWHSMDFEKHRPAAVIIEHEHGDRDGIIREFAAKNYQMIDDNNSNFVFLLKD